MSSMGKPVGATKAAAVSRAKAIFDKHFEWDARFNGDVEPMKAAATAKRTATSLNSALKSFGDLLAPEQLVSLRNAAQAMQDLASDLDTATVLAKRHKVEHDAHELRLRNRQADATAMDRWGTDDAAMLAEAHELAFFLDNWRELEVEEWVLSRVPPGLKYAQREDLRAGGRLLDMLHRRREQAAKPTTSVLTATATTAASMLAIRRRAAGGGRRAAEYVASLARACKSPRTYKDLYYVGLDDYDAWRVWRSAVRTSIMPRVQSR